MNIAIGICTRNSSETLASAVRSVLTQRIARSDRVRIYILDTSDADGTASVVQSLRNALPYGMTIRYLRPRRLPPGISHARKYLMTRIAEPYCFSMDDDIIVGPDWIRAGMRVFSQFPHVVVVGGKTVISDRIPEASKGLLGDLQFSRTFWPYALVDRGGSGRVLRGIRHYPAFSNMAIRMSVARRITIDTRFAAGAGPLPMFGGEDPDFVEQMSRTGRVYYEPKMVVRHVIKPHKLKYRYFLWRYWEWGKERALLETKHGLEASSSAPRLLSALYELIRSGIRGRSMKWPFLQCVFALSYLRAVRIISAHAQLSAPDGQ